MRIQPKLFELMIAGMLLTVISTGSYAQDNCLGKNFNTSICDDRAKFMATLRDNHLAVGKGISTLIISAGQCKTNIRYTRIVGNVFITAWESSF